MHRGRSLYIHSRRSTTPESRGCTPSPSAPRPRSRSPGGSFLSHIHSLLLGIHLSRARGRRRRKRTPRNCPGPPTHVPTPDGRLPGLRPRLHLSPSLASLASLSYGLSMTERRRSRPGKARRLYGRRDRPAPGQTRPRPRSEAARRKGPTPRRTVSPAGRAPPEEGPDTPRLPGRASLLFQASRPVQVGRQ